MTNAELTADVHPSQRREYADILARLLEEYASKLRGSVEKLEKLQSRFLLIRTVSLATFFTISAEALFVQVTRYGIREALEGTMSPYGIVGTVFGVVIAASSLAFRYNYALSRRMLVSDLKSNIEQVTKLIRYSSQVQEIGVTDFATRLELDFKTTDAEEALDLAQSIIKPPKPNASRNAATVKESQTQIRPELVWEEPIGKTGTK